MNLEEQPDPFLTALDELDIEPMETPPALLQAIEAMEQAPDEDFEPATIQEAAAAQATAATQEAATSHAAAATQAPEAPARPGHPLAEPLRLAAEAADEEKFMALEEAALHEADDVAVALLAPYMGGAPAIGRLAAHGLLMLGPASLTALLTALQEGPPAARQPAAWALGSLRDPRTTAALCAVLTQPDAPNAVVEACLDSLAELADRAAVPALLALLRDPERAAFRPRACRALGFIGDPAAVGKIAPLLANPKAFVRLRAAEALVRLLDKRGWTVLFALLRGDDPRTGDTVAALRGLGELSSALAPFLGDDEYHTRRDAAEVLGSFGDVRAVPPLIEAMG
ncbi:MAG: lyase domain protein repeat-containing protein, partial [Cyanobacteria bacterium RYN_339]|nr:lyase domain protein repeat-containing protein [Cyanobacteria bacterium RYN_339]